MRRYGHWLALLFILIVSMALMWPLTHPGLFTAHDIWHQVARFYHYHASIEGGIWPPGWVSNLVNGYGYPLFYFSYHLPWMIGEPLLRLGLSIPDALKVLFVLAIVTSGLTMYWFCWRLTKGQLAAIIGAVVYVIAPYHFLAVYVAAAIGSVFQFTFVPLLFLGCYEICVRRSRVAGVVLVAIGLAASMLTHLMSTVMLLPFVGLWIIGCMVLFARRDWRRWGEATLKLLVAGALAIGLAAFYLLPLFTYKPLILADVTGGFRQLYTTNFVSFRQLLYSPWGFGPITRNAKDGEISMQVGIAQWLGVGGLLSLLVLSTWQLVVVPKCSSCRHWADKLQLQRWLWLNRNGRISGLVLVMYTTVCFSMLAISQPLWLFANTFMTLDYPWRLLMLAVFFGSTAVSLVTTFLKPIPFKVLFIVSVLLVAWYTNRNHIGVNLYTAIPVADYVDAEITTNTFSEYLPLGTNDKFILVKRPVVLEPSAVATLSAQSAVAYEAAVTVVDDGYYTFHHYAFPTLKVEVDGKGVTPKTSGEMLLQAPLSRGTHQVRITAIRTPVILLGCLISLTTLVGLMIYMLIQAAKKYVKT